MKQLTLKLVIPLTVISFAVFTKWWYVQVFDGPDEILTGFPFPFVCRGWHTSLSLQFFIAELLTDFIIYFLFWFLVILCLQHFSTKIKLPKLFSKVLIAFAGLAIAGAGLIAANPDNAFNLRRNFDLEVMETGYKFIWQEIQRPEFYKYHPEKRS